MWHILCHSFAKAVADGMATVVLRVKLFQFKFWGDKQNLIPNGWQMAFANVPVEGWTINPYVN